MLEFLKNGPRAVFAAAAVLFILLSMFSVQDVSKLQLTYTTPIRIPSLLAGVGLAILSLWLDRGRWLSIPLSWTALCTVSRTDQGFKTLIRHATVEVCFGRIQDLSDSSPGSVVALPTNDLFDDKCVGDTRTALGAFANHTFPNRIHEVASLVQQELNTDMGQGAPQKNSSSGRYDIGTALYFNHALGTGKNMAFVAVTTDTKDDGILCEAENVFVAIKGLHRVMNTQRIDTITLPLIGSGHGGLSAEVSLICMLTAFAECLKRPAGKHIKRVRIVVYQRDRNSLPDVTRGQAKRLLAFAQKYC